MGFFDKVFGTRSEREIKKLQPTVNKILALEAEYKALSEDALKAKTQEFKDRLAAGETLDDILGKRADGDLVKKIKALLTEEPQVRGAYDVILNNYGPDKFLGSVHLELPDTMTVEEVDELTRKVQARVLKETGVILTGVGVYSHNTKNDEAAKIRSNVLKLVKAHEWALQFHGFYVNLEEKAIRFDVVMNFEIKPQEGLDILHKEISEAYPDYDLHIAADIDAS